MRKFVLHAVLTAMTSFVIVAPVAANTYNPLERDWPYPDDPWGGGDDCFWCPECLGCQEEDCSTTILGCPDSCYKCEWIPTGPNGEPQSYNCMSGNSSGHLSCTEKSTGCDLGGQCGQQ